MTLRTQLCGAGRRALGLGLGVALAASGAFQVSRASAEECPLKTPLTIADTQDGFAGQIGTVWTVMPDCSFTIARQLGSTVGEPERQGRLTADQQKTLEELLADAKAADLPAELGNGPTVNARRVAMTYDDKATILTLPPGDTDLGELATTLTDDAARRVASFADGVKKLIDD